jgi:hypothetical protein
MPCGCRWTREPGYGDVLHQCAAHRAGAKYPGSEPLTDKEMDRLLYTLRDGGFDAREIKP